MSVYVRSLCISLMFCSHGKVRVKVKKLKVKCLDDQSYRKFSNIVYWLDCTVGRTWFLFVECRDRKSVV